MSKLVIVESPAKAKTITKYLGPGFEVKASMGHIRDLPASKIGIDVDNDYEPKYINIKGKAKLIKELKSAAANSEEVFLATDPDREGEAISWHLAHILNIDVNAQNRVTFGEITKKGITNGMANPRTIDIDLVNAQQARRILDRLVGYILSPFLWRKVRRGLSAGRVQSVAVWLIVDRQKEIDAFIPQEYWNLDAVLSSKNSDKQFTAHLHSKLGGEKLAVTSGEQSEEILSQIKGKDFNITKITKGARKKQPAPPFITSTLQQDASNRLGFTASRTMRAAQTLYEGVDIKGHGVTGLITYMRTDSLRLADEAVAGAKEHITSTYGEEYVYSGKRVYKGRGASNAQDAHEAIRPTNPLLTPDEVDKSVEGDIAKLYRLIWNRFTASQMSDCQQATMGVDVTAGDYLFKASGYVVTFDGFTVLYDDAHEDKDKKDTSLPPLEQGETLNLCQMKPEQKFTQPPALYTEATLIKALEENGIGRPSTYAPIISTVIDRGYVEREQKKLKPTDLGIVVNNLMVEQFSNIVDLKFSAQMESNLDKVENGEAQWVKTVDDFYKEFDKTMAKAEQAMEGKKVKVPEEETDEICELCGKNMVIKTGKYGKFLACPGFPDCKNTKRLVKDTGGRCPKCGKPIILRKSKKGRIFYGCDGYPECEFISWDEPTGEQCPKCGKSLFKKGGKNGMIYCANEGCGFEKSKD